MYHEISLAQSIYYTCIDWKIGFIDNSLLILSVELHTTSRISDFSQAGDYYEYVDIATFERDQRVQMSSELFAQWNFIPFHSVIVVIEGWNLILTFTVFWLFNHFINMLEMYVNNFFIQIWRAFFLVGTMTNVESKYL